MSRNAKMRPATAPVGSRMTASESESQTSSLPRMIETRRLAPTPSSDSRLRWSTCAVVRRSASAVGTPVICSAAAFQTTTWPSRSTATMPSATFARIATLCSRSTATRWYSSAFESATDPFAAGERHAEVGAVAGGEDRVGVRERRVGRDVGICDGCARLDDIAAEPARGGRARAERILRPLAHGRGDDELVALELRERTCLDAEERRGLRDDFLEDCSRVELGREQAAGSRELLRERSRRALGLVQAAALERAARRAGQAPCQFEVVVVERPLLREQHEHEPGRVAFDRDGEQRREGRVAPPLVEAVVLRDARRGDDATVPRGLGEREWELQLAHLRRKLVRAGDGEVAALRRDDGAEVTAERLDRGLRGRVQRLGERERLAEQLGDPVEGLLDARLMRPLAEALRVAERERREARERLEQLQVAVVEGAAPIPDADAEHAAGLAGPDHRRHERPRNPLVCGMRELGDALVRLHLESDEPCVDAVDGGAVEDAARLVEEVAVGSVRSEELRDLPDEALKHRVELQLARHHLRRAQERALLLEPALVLREEARGLERERDLARERVDEDLLALGERLVALHGQGDGVLVAPRDVDDDRL